MLCCPELAHVPFWAPFPSAVRQQALIFCDSKSLPLHPVPQDSWGPWTLLGRVSPLQPPREIKEGRRGRSERGSCQGPYPASDRKTADRGTRSDFTGKMKGNCIFNNSPGRFGGRQVGGAAEPLGDPGICSWKSAGSRACPRETRGPPSPPGRGTAGAHGV